MALDCRRSDRSVDAATWRGCGLPPGLVALPFGGPASFVDQPARSAVPDSEHGARFLDSIEEYQLAVPHGFEP